MVVAPPSADDVEDDPSCICDAVASIQAMRGGLRSRIFRPALEEAKSVRRRLRQAFSVGDADSGLEPARDRLLACLLAADPRLAHVGRRRGKRTAWSNGGTEIELGRDCGAGRVDDVEALVVLSTVALGLGGRDSRVVVTRAMPTTLRRLAQAGLGRERLAEPTVEDGVLKARVERVYAKKVLSREDRIPHGELARQALADLFLQRRLFKKVVGPSRENLEATVVARRLAERLNDVPYWLQEVVDKYPQEPPTFDVWVGRRLEELGVESGEDLELLSPEDLLFPSLSDLLRTELDRSYPRRLKIEGVTYRVDYELDAGKVVLRLEQGKPQKPPDRFYLPRFPGFPCASGIQRSIANPDLIYFLASMIKYGVIEKDRREVKPLSWKPHLRISPLCAGPLRFLFSRILCHDFHSHSKTVDPLGTPRHPRKRLP